VEDTLASFKLEGLEPMDVELEWMCEYIREQRDIYELVDMMKEVSNE